MTASKPLSGAPADQVLFGDVVALDGGGRQAEAVAIRDGRIVAIGQRTDAQAWCSPATSQVDFGRAAIIPGFNDTHAHLDTEGLKHSLPSLAGAHTIGELLERIRRLACERPTGEWIVTMPVGEPPFYFGDAGDLAEGRMPTRHELDRAAPSHPVCVLAASGYWGGPPGYTVLNSMALRLNGIDRHSVAGMRGVEIVKDKSGEPTGVVIDRNFREVAQLDVLPAVPRFTAADREEAIRKAITLYHAHGTTSIYEGHGCSPEVISIYRHLWQAGSLTMRTGLVVSPPWAGVADAETVMRDWLVYARGSGLGDARLRISGVFIALDGDPDARPLTLEQQSDTGFWSHLRHANGAEQYEKLCRLAAKHDLRVHTVASGDRIFDVVPIWERIAEQFDIRSRRWVLEHVTVTNPDCLASIRALGAGVTLIPNHHLWKSGARFLELPPERQEDVVPAQRLYDLGIPTSAGTDNSPINPLSTMRALMTRTERTSGRAIGPRAVTTAETALRILTSCGAWLTFEEHMKGCLLPGYIADCAVLSENPLRVAPERLEDITCLATMMGGAFVHGGPA